VRGARRPEYAAADPRRAGRAAGNLRLHRLPVASV